MIKDSGIAPLAMQTISPHKELDQFDCEHLAGGVRDCIIQRLDPERRIPIFTPLLTVFEANDWDEGFHIHSIIPVLPLHIFTSKKRIRQPIKEALDAVSNLTGMDWHNGDAMTRLFQIEFYKYCIKYPYQSNKWTSKYEHGRMVNFPNGQRNVDYLLEEPNKGYSRYEGWMGLVEYMCKGLLTFTEIKANVCEVTYMKLHHYNEEKQINNNTTLTLDEFFQ